MSKEIDITIVDGRSDVPGALFTVRGLNGGEYDILTVTDQGYYKHRLPGGTPFLRTLDGTISITDSVKERGT